MLEEYDARWPEQFATAAAALDAISGRRWRIEHIGSTSVVGMPAKPVIDLAVRVASPDEVTVLDARLEERGWVGLAAGPRSHLVRVRHDGDERTHIAHFFTHDQWDRAHQRVFRDWLREHPADAERYAAVKRDAVARGMYGRAYTAHKTAIVQEITARAFTARGLPSVDVWDK